MDSSSILVIDDELHIRQFLRAAVEFEGFAVQEASDAEEGIRSATLKPPDLIILDLGLPDLDGSEVIKRLRVWTDVPIIVLSARDREGSKIEALDLGADDFVSKPFGVGELMARIRAAIRNQMQAKGETPVLRLGEIEIDIPRHRVMRSGVEVKLTPKEFDLLWFLASHPRRVFGRDQLMSRVWGYEAALDTGTVTVHVRRLREKIEADPSDPQHLQTVWGVGYRIVP